MKRFLDIVLASMGLVLALPVLAGIAAVLAATGGGPVLFRQVRVGLDRRLFTIFKFRTMYVRDPACVDQISEAVTSTARDPRITPVGRMLRRTSLDELPQLFNILNGTMSLVGPRPVLPEQLLAIPPDRMDRFLVRPGITGWAQVNGRRGLDWLKQLELDVWYAREHSLLLDLRILLRTVSVVLGVSGTYGSVTNNWRSYLPAPDKRKNG